MSKASEISDYVSPGRTIAVRVTPKAAHNRVVLDGDNARPVRIYVTTVPENGKATKAVIKLLAKELGVAKSNLTLVYGVTSRDKVFQID